MSPERFIETTADTVEQAIAQGLAELGVGPSDVIVEVLDDGSRGVFGIGARPAKDRLQVLRAEPPATQEPIAAPVIEDEVVVFPPSMPPVEQTPIVEETPPVEEKRAPRQEREPRERSAARPPRRERNQDVSLRDFEPAIDEDADDASLFADMDEIHSERDMDEEAAVGKVVLNELLERMSIRADIIVRHAKEDKDGETSPYILDVTGGSLQRLVGRRGETLASLQYITRLITSRELQRRANLIVDVNGYKARRAQNLQKMALMMAEQAAENGRMITLEPMPPHERRIVHLALRDHALVSTRSVGEGTGRKITIMPKEQQDS